VTTGAKQRGARSTDLNPTRTKHRPTPGTGTPGAAGESDPLVIADPLHELHLSATPSPHLATEPADDTDKENRVPTTVRERWARLWPSLLAVVTLSAVGGPAAVASYRHARDVIAEHGDPVMAPWLALTTDGMLVAALVVIWVRRHRGEPVKAGPWAAFWADDGDGAGEPDRTSDADVRWLLRTAGSYIEDLGPGGRSVLRLFHDLQRTS
jgi:hypothetical protein